MAASSWRWTATWRRLPPLPRIVSVQSPRRPVSEPLFSAQTSPRRAAVNRNVATSATSRSGHGWRSGATRVRGSRWRASRSEPGSRSASRGRGVAAACSRARRISIASPGSDRMSSPRPVTSSALARAVALGTPAMRLPSTTPASVRWSKNRVQAECARRADATAWVAVHAPKARRRCDGVRSATTSPSTSVSSTRSAASEASSRPVSPRPPGAPPRPPAGRSRRCRRCRRGRCARRRPGARGTRSRSRGRPR